MKKIIFSFLFIACAASAFAASAQEEFDFYKNQIGALSPANTRENRTYAQTLAENLGAWLVQNPTHASAPDALLMQARLYLRADQPGAAIVSLLQLRRLFPTVQATTLEPLFAQAQQGLDANARATAAQLFAQNAPADEPLLTRQTRVLQALSKLSGKTYYAAAQEAFASFFQQHPGYEKNDEVELYLGDLHRANGNYLAAILQYKKVGTLYPATPYKAAALRLTGDVYAGDLKDTAAATEFYSHVLRQFPTSSEIGTVYKHMAILDENNKQYESALINYDKAIERLATTPAAFEAYTGKADVMEKNKDYEGAYNTLLKTGNLFRTRPAQAAAAYDKAATVAKKRLRDNGRYAQALEQALLVSPKDDAAPERLYNLAQAYEQQGKTAQAAATYKKLILDFPNDKRVGRAQSRLDKLVSSTK